MSLLEQKIKDGRLEVPCIVKYFCAAMLVVDMNWWKVPDSINCQLEQGKVTIALTDRLLIERKEQPKLMGVHSSGKVLVKV